MLQLKNMRNSIMVLAIFFASGLLCSCNDWLDVKPQTEIKSEDNFKNQAGFKDALTGIYIEMTKESLYGRELSFGMLDVLAKQHTTSFATPNQEYYYISRYDYTGDSSKRKIASIWSGMYNLLANLNSLIYYIDRADPSLFDGDEYHVIRGEAYALRAFIHFDLLRLFGKSYLVGADTKAIPYVTAFENKLTPLSTVKEVIEKVLGDLAIAEAALAYDPVAKGENSTSYTDYLRNRFYHFNYYAVKLLQARVNLYKGDHRAALDAAEKVINQSVFTWVPAAQVTTSTLDTRNVVFSQELVFTLNMRNITEIAFGTATQSSWFTNSGGFLKSAAEYNTVYETTKYSSEYRYQYQTEFVNNYYRYSRKLYQPANVGAQAYGQRMPIMRISEAYYIAAECELHFSHPDLAAGYLNTVREHRNINDPLSGTLPVSTLQEEIFKEHVKEFICEGQLFFYYKRLNSENIQFYNPGATGARPVDIYVFPLPDDELEFGQRYAE